MKDIEDVDEDALIGEPLDAAPQVTPDEKCRGRKKQKRNGEVVRDDGGNALFGGYCKSWAGSGTDDDEGRCKFHGGNNSGENGQGGTENNGNAETHGLKSDGRKWFERHRDEVEDDVRRMVAGWMDEAPFGWSNHGNVQLLVDAAINECQIRRGDRYIREEGMVLEEFDHIAEDGRQVYEKKENPAFQPKSRLQRDTVRILEKLGILDDPESQKAEATEDLAAVWRADLETEE